MKILLKRLRGDLLLGKHELARQTGLSAQTLSRIEKGLPCRLQTLDKIAKAVGFERRKLLELYGCDD